MIRVALQVPSKRPRANGRAPQKRVLGRRVRDETVSASIRPATHISPGLIEAWKDLAREASEPNSFNEQWFFLAGLHNFPGADAVRLLEVWKGSGRDRCLLGLLPLSPRRDYGRTRVTHVQNWRHFHAFLGTPLVRPGQERVFWKAVLGALDQAEWAHGFLHLTAMSEKGPVLEALEAEARAEGRGFGIVHRTTRAMLASELSPDAYYETNVRKKKRKELQRLSRRLAELGEVRFHALPPGGPVGAWCDDFLSLERSGWKGRAGTALSANVETEGFFRQAVAGAAANDRLQFLRLDLDGKPIAMLVNFLSPPGSFSFKIAFDEEYARFSPGVLIQLENLQILARGDIGWMDSCAAENHPMIESLWAERRDIVRVTVELSGWRRRWIFRLCRLLERGTSLLRALTGKPRIA